MSTIICPECDRAFDMTNEEDATEWKYGHDCEAPEPMSAEAPGNCFEVAAGLVASNIDAELTLCHGVVWHEETSFHAHAWVEQTLSVKFPITESKFVDVDTIVCIDKANGNDVSLPRELYYKLGRINPERVIRYTAAEAIWQMCTTEHYGPWPS